MALLLAFPVLRAGLAWSPRMELGLVVPLAPSYGVMQHQSPCSPRQPCAPAAEKADGEGPSTAARRQELSLFPATSLFFFFFSFPLTISHSLFYIKPCSVLVRSLSCFGFSAPLNFSVLLSRGWGCRLPRLFHCFPVSRGVGEGMWNKETDAFSPLLAKDALNLWSFPQRGLLYIVSLGPGPHRLKPI